MVPHSEDGEGPGHISVQVRDEDHWEAAPAQERQELGVPASGGSTGGSRAIGGTEVNNTEAEDGCAIYFNATDYGPM